MQSTISVHEYADPMCSAWTCWEMSRIRLRKRRHRSRAAASLKKFRLVISCIENFPHRRNMVVGARPDPDGPVLLHPGHAFRAACGGCSKRLLDDGPVIIARIAGLVEQLDPAVRVVMEFGGEHPFLEQRLLFRRAIGVHLDEALAGRQALDFA